jgi:DNA-binding transcriptional ArsR family regulator
MAGPDEVFRALADPTRRLILDELAERHEQTLYELVARLIMKHEIGMTRQAIGKHLAILREAGLVRVERRGKYKVISLDAAPIRRISERWIQKMVKA